MTEKKPVGKTKTQGWEIGVRRTLPVSVGEGWTLLMTQPGIGCWLGSGVEAADFKKGQRFITREGTTGEIRSYEEGSLLRMRWQPPEWDFESTLQIRVQPAKKGATISFHHEKLENGDQREQMRQRWAAVIEKLEALIKA